MNSRSGLLKLLKTFLILFLSIILVGLIPFKPVSNHRQSVAVDNTASISQIEKQALDQVNEHRRKIRLHALVKSAFISDLARQHSRDMASGKVEFGHTGADERFKIISKSIKGTEGAGENVFTCTGNYTNLAKTALDGWLASKGHRENIEGDYNISGMGVAKADNGNYYFTQIFVKRKD